MLKTGGNMAKLEPIVYTLSVDTKEAIDNLKEIINYVDIITNKAKESDELLNVLIHYTNRKYCNLDSDLNIVIENPINIDKITLKLINGSLVVQDIKFKKNNEGTEE